MEADWVWGIFMCKVMIRALYIILARLLYPISTGFVCLFDSDCAWVCVCICMCILCVCQECV